MNTNRQLIEQFLQFINTGDAAIGKPIISDDVIFYAPTSPQTQPLMGMPATGKKICVTAMNIYEFKDGKIIREHGLPDMFSLLMQLGVIPAPGQ